MSGHSGGKVHRVCEQNVPPEHPSAPRTALTRTSERRCRVQSLGQVRCPGTGVHDGGFLGGRRKDGRMSRGRRCMVASCNLSAARDRGDLAAAPAGRPRPASVRPSGGRSVRRVSLASRTRLGRYAVRRRLSINFASTTPTRRPPPGRRRRRRTYSNIPPDQHVLAGAGRVTEGFTTSRQTYNGSFPVS